MDINFPYLHPWQSEVFEDIKEERYEVYCVKAKRQVGKSIVAIASMLYFSLKSKSVSTCVEPTLSQCRRVFKQVVSAVGGDGSPLIKSANATLLSIEFTNGSEIIFKSAEQEEALRGMTVKRGILVIDEAAFIKDSIFEILYPVVDANKCPVLLISTPLFMSGEFYKKYTLGLSDTITKSYDWSRFDTSVFLSKEKLDYYRKTVSPLKFQSEYLGQFISEGSYIFGNISDCIGDYSIEPSVYAGIDWATGNDGDFTVLTMMDSKGGVTKIVSFRDLDAVSQIERLADEINSERGLRCVQVEMNSIGRVFYDNLRRKVSIPIKQFVTTNDSKRTIIENLITAFQKKAITIPNDDELIRELQHYSMEKTQKGYTYNGADGVNDDYCMSLAFAYDAYKHSLGQFKISFA